MPTPAARRPPSTGCSALCRLLGDPERACPVIHITGHQRQGVDGPDPDRAAHGQRADGRDLHEPATSSAVNERLARDGEPIDDDELAEVLGVAGRCSSRCCPSAPTRFELLTAAAFRWFADSAGGRGRGRGRPRRPVGRHQRGRARRGRGHQRRATTTSRSSGPRSRDIATEKAGIIKPGCRLVVGETDPELRGDLRGRPPSGRRGRDLGAGRGLRLRREPAGRRRPAARPAHPGGALPRGVPAAARRATRATTPPSRWPPPRRSSARRSPPRWSSTACGAVTVPGRLEVVGRAPARRARRRPQRRRRRGAGRRRSPRTSPSTGDDRGRDRACSRAATRARMLEALGPAGVRDGRGVHGAVAAGACRPTAIAEAARAARARGRWPSTTVGRRRRRWPAPGVAAERGRLVVTGSLYVVGRGPRRGLRRDRPQTAADPR